MYSPFELKRPIGHPYSMDEDDVLKTKYALGRLGHYRAPEEYGMTSYPDHPMIDGLTGFQRQQGLKSDGIMKPNGPTAKKLGQVLAERNQRIPSPRSLLNAPSSDRRQHTSSSTPSVFRLSGDIGRNRNNHRRDVFAVQGMLATTNHYWPRRKLGDANTGEELFDAVKQFQQDSGLKKDGFARRGGETERALNAHLVSLLSSVDKSFPTRAAATQASMSDHEKDMCDERFRRELQRCGRWPGE